MLRRMVRKDQPSASAPSFIRCCVPFRSEQRSFTDRRSNTASRWASNSGPSTPGQPVLARPLLANPGPGAQAVRPVDGGAAAERGPGLERHVQVGGGLRAAAPVHVLVGPQLVAVELRLVVVARRLQHHHVRARPRPARRRSPLPRLPSPPPRRRPRARARRPSGTSGVMARGDSGAGHHAGARVGEHGPEGVAAGRRVGRAVGEEEGEAGERLDPGRGGRASSEATLRRICSRERREADRKPDSASPSSSSSMPSCSSGGRSSSRASRAAGAPTSPALRAQKPSGSSGRSSAGTTVSQTASSTARLSTLRLISSAPRPSVSRLHQQRHRTVVHERHGHAGAEHPARGTQRRAHLLVERLGLVGRAPRPRSSAGCPWRASP